MSLEDLRIGLERDLGAAALGRAGDGQSAQRLAALVALLVRLVVAPDFQVEPLRQRVHDRHADAVQAARNLVGVVVELAAGVQHRQHDFGGRLAALVHVGRNAAAVVDDGDRVVEVNRDVDFGAEAGERFVDRVVDDFVDQVMQSGRPGGADVHRRALADRFEAFEDLDAFRAVVALPLPPLPYLCVSLELPTLVSRFDQRSGCIVSAFFQVDAVSHAHRHDDVGVVVTIRTYGLHHCLADFVLQLERHDFAIRPR